MKIITIGREFGSGGREIGKRLAEFLGITYLDGEIAEAVARETNLDKNYLDTVLENGISDIPVSYAHSFSRISPVSDSARLIAKQHKVIKEMAAKSDCVIVGRGADAVLGSLHPFRIFVYADMQSKIERCRKRSDGENLSDKEIIKKLKSIDKARKATHDLYSSTPWGDKSGYELCINTTGIDIPAIIPLLAEYIGKFFDGRE